MRFERSFQTQHESALVVKLAKHAITATTYGAQLTDEELVTVAAECKAMLSNQPLKHVGPEDPEPLTSAHS